MDAPRISPVQKLLICYLIITIGYDMRTSSYVFKRCELARELLSLEFPEPLLPDWVCLVENESGRNTSAKGGPNSNGSYDYGIFQINSRYWCGDGKDCGIPCSDLIDDDIRDDAVCALKIYRRQGFNAWHGWTKRCKNATKPNLDNCFPTTGSDKDNRTPTFK
ncbi:lysozyme-like [Ischnura elegans]|uniref:lysozyme-like n=1 Tax=Ischnura elegans TaxID=197161 RepID=UPI001ED887D5|nr:lysozyme-like [Ischnura elegans]